MAALVLMAGLQSSQTRAEEFGGKTER